MRASLGPGLTARERQVALLVREGLTDREIATRLFISRRTAEWYLKQIFNKLGVASRAQVAAWVAEERTISANKGSEPFRSNLPEPLTTFIGRDKELVVVRELVSAKRLVTLCSVGGGGKTRLALQAASQLSDAYTDGTWFADLSPITDGRLVVRTVASALRIHERPREQLIDGIVNELRTRQVLIVLDNCEHVIDQSAELVSTILRECAGVRFLVTSREPLGLNGEVVWRVPPLEIPDPNRFGDLSALMACDSVRLFIDRAALVEPGFQLTHQNAAAIGELCVTLEGLPLAVELAASRVGSMSPTDIAHRLEDRFALLAARSRAGPDRHRTLRSTLEWSHDLLNDTERRLFGRLSVFAGGFTLEAAESACAFDGIGKEQVADLLTALVDKSLIVAAVDSGDKTRLRMLDTVREFARQKLHETNEAAALDQLHCQFFTALAETSSPHLRGRAALEWRDRLTADLNNYRTALKWSATTDPASNARLNTQLVDLWHFAGLIEEADAWMDQALTTYASRDEIRAQLLHAAAKVSFWRADWDRNSAQCNECLEIHRGLGRGKGLALAVADAGQAAQWKGDLEGAHRYFEEAFRLASQTNEEVGLETTLRFMGRLAMVEGNHAKASALLNESISINERNGDQRSKAWSTMYLGLNSVDSGDYAAAQTQLRASLAISLALDLTIVVATCLMYFGALEAALSRPVRALRLAGAATSLAQSAGAAPMRLTKPVVDRWLERARRELGPRRSEKSLEEGRAMARDRAIEYASQVNRLPR